MIAFRMKDSFLDRKHVADVIGKKAAGALIRIGGYIRTAARNSMRDGTKTQRPGKARKPSAPGKPPKAWTRLLKDRLFFAWDSSTASVVIGPELLRTRASRLASSDTIPAIHEFGGTTKSYSRKGKAKNARYPKRPYMRPAFEKSVTRPKLQAAFDSVKSTSIGPR